MSGPVRLVYQVPWSVWLTSNHRLHWAKRREKVGHLRAMGCLVAAAKRLRPFVGPVRVVATISTPDNRRFDPANAEPTVKALLDGVTDSRLIADDDSRHVESVTFQRGQPTRKKGVYRVTLEIIPV